MMLAEQLAATSRFGGNDLFVIGWREELDL